MSDWLTTTDTAQRLGCCTAYVRYLLLTGQIPYLRLGRNYVVSTDDVEAFKTRRDAKRKGRKERVQG